MCGMPNIFRLAADPACRAGVYAASTVVVSEAVLKKLSNLESVTGADWI